ncbi:integrase family protein [Burkholderiales bacterium GJ-E10]|nr:integrase family protein [Burkholderiales bacterium GJ-E10]
MAYGVGLRAGEVVALKTGDIDSTRMTLCIEQGKWRKDRYALEDEVEETDARALLNAMTHSLDRRGLSFLPLWPSR